MNQGLIFRGDIPITSTANDTVENWKSAGNGIYWVADAGRVNNQPSQYAFILNMANGSDVNQLWFPQSSGPMRRRSGNGSGWATSWVYFSEGTATAAQVLSGYTFSSAVGSNISGAMPNRGALNWTPSGSDVYNVPAGYYSGGTLNSNSAYSNGYNAGQTAKRNNVTLQKIGPSDDDIKHATYTFSASSGRCYIAAMAGDPGAFQNFGISGATLLSNIYCGDTPPNGTEFARMISFRANGGNVTITWNSGSYQPYMILALVN